VIKIKRFKKNPILQPDKRQSWEAEAAFNGCPVKKDGKIYLLYRALSLPHYHAGANIKMQVSDIGRAESTDGLDFHKRRRFIVPEKSWERYGCEDPRVTELNGKYYIFYTALSNYPFTPDGIKIGVAISHDMKTISEKHLVTPFNAKAMALFPEKIKGKMHALLTVNTDLPPSKIALASFKSEDEIWSEKYWSKWYKDLDKHALPFQRNPEDQVELGAPPVKTEHGWLVIYSHIKNYHSPERLFGIEAVLLDLKNPSKIVSRTFAPIMIPEAYYELYGVVPHVIFPSGVLLEGDELNIYYGAADTTCCVVSVGLKSLIRAMNTTNQTRLELKRSNKNPIIEPIAEHSWESKATFNPAAFYEDGRVHIVYRAMSDDNTSVMGYATSKDGIHIDTREKEPIYVPREPFEQKLVPNGNSGCEDPRITKIDDTLYMCYTAFDGRHPPRIAITSISVDNFLKKKWNWSKPTIVSPPDFDDKDACIFPEKVNGKYLIFHRIGEDIDTAIVPDLKFEDTPWLEERRWISARKGMWDNEKVGVAAPPIKTKDGWLLLYHGVSSKDFTYRVGALLLNLKDPTEIIARTDYPILTPEKNYEKTGQVSRVVFPCGNVVIGNKLFVYYGGGDSVVGVATISIKKILKILKE
jgi:predicted GH43/DUF377 family glycosyl hydrolase